MGRQGLFRDILDNLYDGAYYVDREHRIVYWNRSAEELTGYRSDEVIGQSCDDTCPFRADDDVDEAASTSSLLSDTLEDGQLREGEGFIIGKGGHRVPVSVRVAPVRDRAGRITGAVEVFSENSAMLEARSRIGELERSSAEDALTGLPNRRRLEQDLVARSGELARFGRTFGVLAIDVDRFADVNEFCGREVGDDILRMVGSTLLYNCRPFDTVGRWEGEQFLGVVVGVDRRGLARVAERLREAVGRAVYPWHGRSISVTVSVGAVMAEWGDSVELVVQRAEQMLERSKSRGRDKVTVWE